MPNKLRKRTKRLTETNRDQQNPKETKSCQINEEKILKGVLKHFFFCCNNDTVAFFCRYPPDSEKDQRRPKKTKKDNQKTTRDQKNAKEASRDKKETTQRPKRLQKRRKGDQKRLEFLENDTHNHLVRLSV